MENKKNIVIVGRDAALWLSANALIRALGSKNYNFEIIELPSLLDESEIYSSLPNFTNFKYMLGINEMALVKATKGSFSLGNNYVNFTKNNAYSIGFGTYGFDYIGDKFTDIYIKARHSGLNIPFDDFCLNNVAARQNKFFIPDTNTNLLGNHGYGYNYNAKIFCAALKSLAEARGAKINSTRKLDLVLKDGISGRIIAIEINQGLKITGDIFIDATTSGLLIEDTLESQFSSVENIFLANRVLNYKADKLKEIPSYTQVKALPLGTLHLTGLQNYTNVQQVYHSKHMNEEVALETAMAVSGLNHNNEVNVKELRLGYRKNLWVKNCIAIGTCAASIYPIDNLELHIIQTGLSHLINLFPNSENYESEANIYNRIMNKSFENMIDFSVAHFKLNTKSDTYFWKHYKEMKVSDTLEYKIELFKSRGMIAYEDEETFTKDNWRALFFGNGILPHTYNPTINIMNENEAIQKFQIYLKAIGTQVVNMSSNDAFIELHAEG